MVQSLENNLGTSNLAHCCLVFTETFRERMIQTGDCGTR